MKLVRHISAACLVAAATMSLPMLAPVAFASGGSGGESSDKASNKTIDMSGLVLPVEQDGKLINYLFVSAMITIAQGYDHWEVRENAHVYRDLLLKAAHRETVGLEGHPMELDKAIFEKIVNEVFDSQLGPHSVERIEIMAVDSQKIFVGG